MIEYNIHLKKCKCGHRAELIAESIAHAKYDDVGNRTDIWFVDNPFYCARCTECNRETAWVGNIQTAVNDWNEDRIYYDDDEDEEDYENWDELNMWEEE